MKRARGGSFTPPPRQVRVIALLSVRASAGGSTRARSARVTRTAGATGAAQAAQAAATEIAGPASLLARVRPARRITKSALATASRSTTSRIGTSHATGSTAATTGATPTAAAAEAASTGAPAKAPAAAAGAACTARVAPLISLTDAGSIQCIPILTLLVLVFFVCHCSLHHLGDTVNA